ncbi:peptidylprolyl isomerase CPR7 KNAG_0I00450 [Huiozyma naganishii CBS 8797]|uniref:peptidylprolyl isomerase n=1 Tax=Huiozyma naganishii (strain ATCC MYA-139 / BCRC 22969 / CBS 8797 / KCTC 17520 / NBRC 10181 / NCYC 3082 / Yp74L-3) TaxID=1071383 RepID=J7SA05_HUIN7|nr:hypothetical protein KNAG_0I00450 [Kazachstania naganishii CBS 8797]CCK71836.1 hypothetical protein KNAG_0I00450 [Kazachstania naganishii CBS 8797]
MCATKFTYFDISISDESIGRVVFELFADKAPKTVQNFYRLCVGDKTVSGFPKDGSLSYKGNAFHRLIKNFMVQAGDVIYGSDETYVKSDSIGKGGCSIYATENEFQDASKELACYGNFDDENLGTFEEPFVLAMANTGSPNSNSSQFFIVTFPSPHLNGKHSIFGRVIHGKSVVRTMERVSCDSDGFPTECVKISDCGEWNDSMGVPLYNASNDPIGGDYYEEYPTDDQHFDSEDFGKAVEAVETIKEAGTLLYKKKDFMNAYFKYKKALAYVNEFVPEYDIDKENNVKLIELKKKLYLNICLMLFYLQRYSDSITYTKYLLECDNVSSGDEAKAYLRRGNCNLKLGLLDDALKDFQSSEAKNPDDGAVKTKIEYTETLLTQKKEKTKKNLAKFFK